MLFPFRKPPGRPPQPDEIEVLVNMRMKGPDAVKKRTVPACITFPTTGKTFFLCALPYPAPGIASAKPARVGATEFLDLVQDGQKCRIVPEFSGSTVFEFCVLLKV
jgi:hypothetical protein